MEQFSDQQSRVLVSMSAWRVFRQDAAWLGFGTDMRCAMLGDITPETYAEWDGQDKVSFSRDQLDRIVLIHAIRSGLERLFGGANAALDCLNRAYPAEDPIFSGRTMLDHARKEGIVGLYQILTRVEGLLDELAAGAGDAGDDDLLWHKDGEQAPNTPRTLH